MKVYDDKVVMLDTPIQPALTGHVSGAAHDNFEKLTEDDFAHVMSACSFASMALFEGAGAQGTNILLHELGALICDVLARSENDGIDFRWEPKKFSPSELDEVADRIRSCFDRPASKVLHEITPTRAERPLVITEKNYLTKQLDRIP